MSPPSDSTNTTDTQVVAKCSSPSHSPDMSNLRIKGLLLTVPKLDTDLVTTITPDTFHPFPRLPIELGLNIWRVASHAPRKIITHPKDSWPLASSERIESQSRNPNVLGVCKKSREEALKHYELCVESSTGSPGDPGYGMVNSFYINFAVDVFSHDDGFYWLSDLSQDHYGFAKDDFEKVRNFELSVLQLMRTVFEVISGWEPFLRYLKGEPAWYEVVIADSIIESVGHYVDWGMLGKELQLLAEEKEYLSELQRRQESGQIAKNIGLRIRWSLERTWQA